MMLNDTTFRSTSLLLLSLLSIAPFQLLLPTLSVFAFSTPYIITDSPLSQKGQFQLLQSDCQNVIIYFDNVVVLIFSSAKLNKVFKSRWSQLNVIKLSKKSINKKQKFKGTADVKKKAGNSLNEEEIRQYLTSKFNNQSWEATSNENQSAIHQLGSPKRLDKLPALILNADYQVGKIFLFFQIANIFQSFYNLMIIKCPLYTNERNPGNVNSATWRTSFKRVSLAGYNKVCFLGKSSSCRCLS